MADTRRPVFISRLMYHLDPPYMVLELVCQQCDHGGLAEANTAAEAVERSAELFARAVMHVQEAHPELAEDLGKALFGRPLTARGPNE